MDDIWAQLEKKAAWEFSFNLALERAKQKVGYDKLVGELDVYQTNIRDTYDFLVRHIAVQRMKLAYDKKHIRAVRRVAKQKDEGLKQAHLYISRVKAQLSQLRFQ